MQPAALHLDQRHVELRPLRDGECKVGVDEDGGGVGDEDVVSRIPQTALAHDDLRGKNGFEWMRGRPDMTSALTVKYPKNGS